MSAFLVTGGAGFIGSNLVETILRAGDDARVLDDFSTGRRENLEDAGRWAGEGGGSFTLIEGDIRDESTVREAVAGVDFVLHQAAMPSVPRSVRDPVNSNEVNVRGTLLLLQAARESGVRRFVFASSSSIYGESEELPKRETMRRAPISPYGLQKMTAESYCGLFHALYGLPTVALRYFNIFGPRQDPGSEYSAVIPKFIEAIRNDGSPTIHGDGEQTRDFTYIDNAVQANLKACTAGEAAFGRTFNVGCGDRISLNGLVEQLYAFAGKPPQAVHGPPREGDIKHSLAAIDAAREALGYAPTVDIADGLRRTWEAFD